MKPFKIDVNSEKPLPPAKAKAIETFVLALKTYAPLAHAFIEKQLTNKKDSTVKDFLEFHLDELPPKVLAKLVNKKSKLAPERQLLAKLVLERVGIYPQAKGDGFAVLDFTFEGNRMVKGRRAITDQILAVYLTAKGKPGHLSHES